MQKLQRYYQCLGVASQFGICAALTKKVIDFNDKFPNEESMFETVERENLMTFRGGDEY